MFLEGVGASIGASFEGASGELIPNGEASFSTSGAAAAEVGATGERLGGGRAAASSGAEHHPGNQRLGSDLPSRATLAAEAGAAGEEAGLFGESSVGAAQRASRSAAMNDAQLPHRGGLIRYVPPENWTGTQPLPKGPSRGYMDRFGNEWVKGRSITPGESFEWDVQRPDGTHWNVSQKGEFTHRGTAPDWQGR